MRMPKKALSALLTFAMVAELLPLQPAVAFADEVDETEAVELVESVEPEGPPAEENELAQEPEADVAEEPEYDEPVSFTVPERTYSSGGAVDNDGLFNGYVEQLLAEGLPGAEDEATLRPQSHLTGNEKLYYDYLKPVIAQIAAGERTSTKITIPTEELFGKSYFSADELGVGRLIGSNGRMTDAASQAMNDLITADLDSLMNALLTDLPYEMYWYNKTSGVKYGEACYSVDGGYVIVTADYVLSFSVSSDYASSTYAVNSSKVARVNTAIAKAKQVVADNAGKSPYDQLTAFKEAICELVSYNHSAAQGSGVGYGDPWQLVSVFDGDSSTNVVCEGYAKAFKYLVDLANIAGVEARLVTGTMSGGTGEGAHMWNVVRMPDGRNYLVDVTNCDEGTIGADDLLFVKPYVSGGVDSQYVLQAHGEPITYAYDDSTRSTFTEDELTLSSAEYDPNVVQALDLSAATVSAPAQTYTGAALKPAVSVTLDGRTLASGTDYTVAYSGNVNAGTATITVTGTGVYKGTATGSFKINAKSVSGVTVTGVSDKTYTGSAQTQSPTVKDGSVTLKSGTDYTLSYASNVNAGTATMTITGKGNYTGTKAVTFKIAAASLADATVTAADQTWTGSALKPAVTVKLGSKTLASGTDYTVEYTSNTAVGTAVVYVTGKGNYTGRAIGTFEIAAQSLVGASVTASAQTFTGSALKPAVTVKLGSKTLASGTDYTVAYASNTAVGTATVTVTGKGTYAGTATGTFKINAKAISGAAVTVASGGTYDGTEKKPAVTVTDGSRTLVAGTDYTVAYKDNTTAGTATATITGKGNYTGTKAATFAIAQADISKATVTVADAVLAGKAAEPVPTVKLNGRTLVAGTDYTVAYKNNTTAGAATLAVTGKGNYKGTKTATFEIAVEPHVAYRTHVQNVGWQGWSYDGAMSGTSGRSLRLEAIQIELTGGAAEAYDVWYRVHAQNFGWMGWASNGGQAGTATYGYRLEAIQVVVLPKGSAAPGATYRGAVQATPAPFAQRLVQYRTHVQNVGWQGWSYDGAMSGTSGRSLRLEGIEVKLPSAPYSGGLRYATHVQNIGWQGWRADGAMSGTSGRSLRLEAIRIELTGEMAARYDVWYRVHAQNVGWMGWAKNGQDAGTAGYSYRLEGIQVVLLPKGSSGPGATYQGVRQATPEAFRQRG